MKNKILKIFGINLLNIISKTWRIKIFGQFPSKPAIIVFWHNEMLPVWRVFAKKDAYAIVSQSKDGQLLSDLLERWGFLLIRGSSSKGGKEVMNEMVQKAKENYVLLTPDGPRGPRHIMKPGAIVAAQRADAKFYYFKVDMSNKITFKKSWDIFEFPLPFSKIYIEISDAYVLSKDLTNEEITALMNDIEGKMKC